MLRNEIQRHPVSWTTCRRTLLQFLEDFTLQDAEVLSFTHAEVCECLQQLCLVDAWPFLKQTCYREGQHLSTDISDWEAWCTDIAYQANAWDHLQPLPRTLCRQKVVLHAYAGRRRPGDVEWYIEAVAKKYPDFQIFVASVDIVIDGIYGDISREDTRTYWVSHIAQGHVVGFFAGPPCNTWSKARHHSLGPPESTLRGPRVVRTPTEPWGRSSLRLTELAQVNLGTLLLGFAFQCIVALALRSGTGFIEHPRDPEEEEKVSIWRLPILRMILTLPNLRLVHLAQGLFGAPSAKPTTLLVLGMTSLEMALYKQMLAKTLPTGASVGRDQDGQFRTAPLKEYPPALCKALAESLMLDLTCTECGAECLPADLIQKCKDMAGQLFGQHIGHDG